LRNHIVNPQAARVHVSRCPQAFQKRWRTRRGGSEHLIPTPLARLRAQPLVNTAQSNLVGIQVKVDQAGSRRSATRGKTTEPVQSASPARALNFSTRASSGASSNSADEISIGPRSPRAVARRCAVAPFPSLSAKKIPQDFPTRCPPTIRQSANPSGPRPPRWLSPPANRAGSRYARCVNFPISAHCDCVTGASHPASRLRRHWSSQRDRKRSELNHQFSFNGGRLALEPSNRFPAQ